MNETIPSLMEKLDRAKKHIDYLESLPVVERVVTERVEVPVDRIKVVTERVEVDGPIQDRVVKERVPYIVEKLVYHTDPAQEEMIRKLQDRIRELESGD